MSDFFHPWQGTPLNRMSLQEQAAMQAQRTKPMAIMTTDTPTAVDPIVEAVALKRCHGSMISRQCVYACSRCVSEIAPIIAAHKTALEAAGFAIVDKAMLARYLAGVPLDEALAERDIKAAQEPS